MMNRDDAYDDEGGEYYDGASFYGEDEANEQQPLQYPSTDTPSLSNYGGHDADMVGESLISPTGYDTQSPMESRNGGANYRSGQNWSAQSPSYLSRDQNLQTNPFAEDQHDEEGGWADEGNGGNGFDTNGNNQAKKPSPLKAMSKNWKLLLVASVVALGGLTGLLAWMFTSGPLSPVSANATVPDTGEPNNDDLVSNPPGLSSGTNQSIDNSTEMNTTISLPRSSFNTTCSRDSVTQDQQSINDCEEICSEAACCYANTNQAGVALDSCLDLNEDACAMYSPLCDFFYGPLSLPSNATNITDNATEISTIPRAPGNLLGSCGKNGSVTTCLDACYSGYCCYSSAVDIANGANITAPSCYDRSLCEEYTPCLWSIVSTLSTEAASQKIPNPPDDLADLCSDGSLDTQIGIVKCMTHCSKALCCIDENSTDSCIAENIDKCAKYSPCSRILMGLVTATNYTEPSGNQTANTTLDLPLPSPDLIDICDPASYNSSQENLTACATECEVALCCYDEVDSCLQDQLNTCLAYFPCQSLIDFLGKAGNVPGASANITASCGEQSRSTNAGRIECLNDCFPGRCCFDPDASCFESNVFTCLGYSPCEAIIDLTDGTFKGIVPLLNSSRENGTVAEVAPPPSNLSEICSNSSVLTDQGLADCTDVCSNATCCTSDTGNCYASNSATCDLYEDCLNLIFLPLLSNTTGGSNATEASNSTDAPVEPPPDNLKEICHANVAFISADCRLACEPASCCYSTDNSCLVDQSALCDLFSPCSVFRQLGGDQLNNTDILEACLFNASLQNASLQNASIQNASLQKASLKNESLQNASCADLCFEGSCCFMDSNVTASCAANRGFCNYYLPCKVLHDSLNVTDNSTSIISDLCDLETISNDTDALQKCTNACQGWECCFLNQNEPASCQNRTDFCLEYLPCIALTSFENASISVEEVCLPQNLTSTASVEAFDFACEWLCKEGACCFLPDTDADSCANETDFCVSFDACGVLGVGNVSLPTFGNETLNSSLSTSPSSSLAYAPSASPFPTSENFTLTPMSETPSLGSSIDDICNVTNMLTDIDREACIEVCLVGSCCFLDESIPESCKNETDFCTLYLPCAWIADNSISNNESNSTLNSTSSNSTLDMKCSNESISTPDGLAECQALCVESSCCRRKSSNADSCQEKVEYCSRFEVCSNLPPLNDTQSTKPVNGSIGGNPVDPFPGTLGGGNQTANTKELVQATSSNSLCTQESIDSLRLVRCFEMCDEWSCCYDSSTGCDENRAKDKSCGEIKHLCAQIIDINAGRGH